MKLHLPSIHLKDNTSNHETLKFLMLHDRRLEITFNTDYRGLPFATVETTGVKRFAYYLNNDSLQWLLDYLLHGEIEDFGINPCEVDTRDDVELPVFMQLVQDKVKMQYIPLLRENTGKVKALASCERGTIFFKLKGTPELLQYLKANDQPVNLLVG